MDKSAPRFRAGSMSLPETAGGITAMCSCGEFVEIYTENETYRLKSPAAIDPEITNPNTPWVSSKCSDFGSSNDIVARVLLQGSDMVHSATLSKSDVDKERVIKQLHSCKEALLICEKIRLRVTESAETIVQYISNHGVNIEFGRHIKDLPQVPNLDEDATSFLINIKRAIVSITNLASMLLPLDKKHSSLEYLKKSIEMLNDEKYRKLLLSIDELIPPAKHLVDLRNFQEHPGDNATYIENFTITSKNEVGYPVWYVNGNPPESIIASMKSAISFGVTLAETMLIHYLFASMDGKFPYFIEVIPESAVEKTKPIRYRLSIDINAIQFGN